VILLFYSYSPQLFIDTKEVLFMLIALYVLLALLAAVAVFTLLVAWKVSGMILHPRVFAYDTVIDEEVKRGSFTRSWFDANVHLEDFTLRSGFGYDLHCALWPREEAASFPDGLLRVAVLAHGFSYCLLGQIKYAALFHALGFDCVLCDHRNHGLSGRAPTTMGVCEAEDLATVCAWARARFGEDALLGTHGESMGAATVMLHASQDARLAFAVEDCGFSDFYSLMRYVLPHRYHLPALPVLPIASLFSRLRGGVSFRNIRPVEALKRCALVPMLFIHGDADELIPAGMMQACYSAKPGAKAKWLVQGAPHAGSWHTDADEYRNHLERFLSQHGIL
jgi:hypothetical protein